MHVPLATSADTEIKFEIAVTRSRLADVFTSGIAQRSTSEVGMQDHAGGIDYRPQRIAHGMAKLLFDRGRQARKRKLQSALVEQSECNFLPQSRNYGARRVCHQFMSVARDQCDDRRAAHYIVHGRQFAK